jgi:hypothetical protein
MMDHSRVGAGVAPRDETIVAVLNEANRLLQTMGWTRFSMARGACGEAVRPDSAKAASYCLSGALVKAWRTIDPENEEFYFPYFEKKLSAALRKLHGYEGGVTRWNDGQAASLTDVVALIDAVIATIAQS